MVAVMQLDCLKCAYRRCGMRTGNPKMETRRHGWAVEFESDQDWIGSV